MEIGYRWWPFTSSASIQILIICFILWFPGNCGGKEIHSRAGKGYFGHETCKGVERA